MNSKTFSLSLWMIRYLQTQKELQITKNLIAPHFYNSLSNITNWGSIKHFV